MAATDTAGPVVLHSPDEAEPYVEAWRSLAASQAWSSYFCTPDWQLAWWETVAGRAGSLVAVWPGVDGLDAVVGLTRSRLRSWELLGSGAGAADHLGWAVRPGCAPNVRAWLQAHVGNAPLLLRNCDPASEISDLVGPVSQVTGTPCPRVSLGEGPLPTGSSGLRKRVRYDERRLAADGINLSWLPPGQVGPSILDDLLRLHAARAGTQRWSTSFTTARLPLHHALLARATWSCGPAAVVAARGNEIVGVLYGYRWRESFAYYQTGWDQRLSHLGLGTVLVAKAMREARDSGCQVFDFLRGSEPYKYRFGAEDRVDDTWLAGRGARAALLRARLSRSARREAARAAAVRD